MGSRAGGTPERPALFFDGADDFDAWLAAHHDSEQVLWMGLNRAHVVPRGLVYADAVPVALRWGWIDSTTQSLDADATRQRWSPRRPGGTWSRANIAHVRRMIAEGTMQPAGLAAFERRLDESSEQYAYEMGESGLAAEHEGRLRAAPAAAAFWDATTPSYRTGVASWIARAKRPETRERRFAQLLADSAAGRLIAPLRSERPPAWLARAADAAAAASEQAR